jgi:hypothetical protein
MSDSDPASPPFPPQPPVDPLVTQGIYSTGLIVIHTRDEFMLDFLSGLDTPKVVGRVVATPAHAKRMLRALLENFGRYEQTFGAISPQLENSRAKPGQVKDIYSQLHISVQVLGGTFSNGLVVKHTQDVFVMDFTINFPPASKVNARFLASPAHLRRIISVLGDNLSQYEERFGKLDDGGTQPQQPLWISLN